MDWSALLFWFIVAILLMVVITFAVTVLIVLRIFQDTRRSNYEMKSRVDRVRRHL